MHGILEFSRLSINLANVAWMEWEFEGLDAGAEGHLHLHFAGREKPLVLRMPDLPGFYMRFQASQEGAVLDSSPPRIQTRRPARPRHDLHMVPEGEDA